MRTSPLGIQAILHYYYSPEPHPMWNNPAVLEVTARFFQEGLIEKVASEGSRVGSTGVTNGLKPTQYRTTLRGSAWVEMICSTPLPVEVWIDPQTGKQIPLI